MSVQEKLDENERLLQEWSKILDDATGLNCDLYRQRLLFICRLGIDREETDGHSM
jgi:hypothetical protein